MPVDASLTRVQPRFVQTWPCTSCIFWKQHRLLWWEGEPWLMLLYFSTRLFPSATRGCRRGDSTRVLPQVETFGLSLLTLRVNGALPIAARDRETQMEKEEEKPQARQECLRDAVKVQIPPASPKGSPSSVPSSFDKTRLHQTLTCMALAVS